MDPYDTWEQTEAAMSAIDKTVKLMCELKPKKDSPNEKVWEAEMKEVRKWIVSVHYRRIAINQSKA